MKDPKQELMEKLDKYLEVHSQDFREKAEKFRDDCRERRNKRSSFFWPFWICFGSLMIFIVVISLMEKAGYFP